MSLSRTMHGLDVFYVLPNSLMFLEITHWEMAKIIQGLSQSIPNPDVLPASYWVALS